MNVANARWASDAASWAYEFVATYNSQGETGTIVYTDDSGATRAKNGIYWPVAQGSAVDFSSGNALWTQGDHSVTATVVTRCGRASRTLRFTVDGQPPRSSCADYLVVDVHGSGSDAGEASPPGLRMFNMLKHPGTGLPAVRFGLITTPIKASGGLPTLAGGVAKLPAAYHQSVVRMKNWLTSELTTLRTKCPQSKVVITGYSQGAQVAGDVYQSGIWPNVLVVVLYGDPYYNHNDTSDRFGMNVASKRPTTTHDGALGTRPAFNDWHVLTFCHQGDPVCQGLGQLPRYGFTQHNNYANLNDTAPAAGWVFSRIPPS